MKDGRPSRTKGREKGGNCVKTDIKTWGANVNPYKLRGGYRRRYAEYCALTSGMNK